jgi:hypothetical protein
MTLQEFAEAADYILVVYLDRGQPELMQASLIFALIAVDRAKDKA